MASVNLSISEFSELCRLCGSKTSVLLALHIFEREGDLRQIYKKITECLPIQVSTDDKLPKMVCEECVYKLDALFEFRERSMKTEFALSNMLKMYHPVCHDSMSLHQMDTLICGTPTSDDSLHVRSVEVYQQVGVDLVNSSSDQIVEDLITRLPPTDDPGNVKCEPELMIKVESPGLRQATANLHPEIESDNDSDCLAHVDQSDACTLSDLQVQDIRGLEAMDDVSIKTDVSQPNSEYLVHPETDHPWFFCNICGKPFDNSDEFQAHCEIHWKKCTLCGISCANEDTLLIHMRESHSTFETLSQPPTPQLAIVKEPKKPPEPKKDTAKGDMKVCNQCGKEYRTNYKLAEHMRKHTGEKPFKCSTCEKAFRSKIGLAQHEAQHTGQYDYTCNACGKGFQCKSYLIVHQRVHSDVKPYPCDTCGRNFKTKQSLLDHHNRHLGVKPYLCETCGRGFITKGLCKAHQKVHSGTDNRQYPCSVCNKLFVSKSYLATHLRIHTGEKPFMCEVCGKGFLTRVDLRIHSTMHTGEKSFVCELCGKAFARRDALRCHRRSHTGERPYRCDICGQGFTQFSPMAIHKRLHTGERPYACDICEKTFVSRSTMMAHKKKHNN